MSNFSFFHCVFKRLVSQGRQKVSLCGNGLMLEKKQILISRIAFYHSKSNIHYLNHIICCWQGFSFGKLLNLPSKTVCFFVLEINTV